MYDLIDRQGLLNKICDGCGYIGYCHPDRKKCAEYERVESMPSVEPEQRWIPVSERLPEEYKDVLCCYEYFRYGGYNCMFRTIDIGYYGNGIWGGEAGQGHKNKVLAWMPLPEPYKEN